MTDTAHRARIWAAGLIAAAALAACSTGTGGASPTPTGAPTAEALEPQQALAQAIGENDPDAARAAIERGADASAPVGEGPDSAPLEVAVLLGSSAVVPVLVEAGADPDAVAPGRVGTLVARAAAANDLDMVAALIEAGADPALMPDETSWGPTLYGGYTGDTELLGLLFDLGVDLDIRDHHGYTALHIAAATGRMSTVTFLLDLGADPAAVADNGFTPADSAADRGHDDVAEFLRGLG
jgi:ankyrin repeat protein